VRFVQILRTPDERFLGLPNFGYEPRYAEVTDADGRTLRMAWVEDGACDGEPIVLLHGEPTWSFLWRKVIPPLASIGLRVIAVDQVGFGRSDKPTDASAFTFANLVECTRQLLLDRLGLDRITLVGQDWGGMVGLRVLAENSERFARVVVTNTSLPTGDHKMPDPFWAFRRMVKLAPRIDFGALVSLGCTESLTAAERAAYSAPFPDDSYCTGPRTLPEITPVSPDDAATVANRAAWQRLIALDLPALVAFSDSDPMTSDMRHIFARVLPGARGRRHPVYRGAGHMVAEDAGEALGEDIAAFVKETPLD
jgi:haloalkane dehalogenase